MHSFRPRFGGEHLIAVLNLQNRHMITSVRLLLAGTRYDACRDLLVGTNWTDWARSPVSVLRDDVGGGVSLYFYTMTMLSSKRMAGTLHIRYTGISVI